uniref:Nodulin-like domain-containing protein n=1 Tax=Panagrellus redivivus TaxID=6233 RepID=A0A7E4V2H1_PANRE
MRMFVKVVASPSGTRFRHQKVVQNTPPLKSARCSFGGTPSSEEVKPKKRSVVSSSSQIKFTALAQMAEKAERIPPVVVSNEDDDIVMIDTNKDKDSDSGAGTNLIVPQGSLPRSSSLTSLRRAGRRIRNNHCCVALFFLFSGLACNGISYMISVQTAALNAEAIDAAVANHASLKLLKKAAEYGPSKYIIGLCNFFGRVTSALGTFFLAQAVVTWLQRRRSNTLRKAAGHADEAVGELHGGCGEIVGDCWANCVPAFG